MICLPWERWYGKHLQQMSDKCGGGGIIWQRAVFSSLANSDVRLVFRTYIFFLVDMIWWNLRYTLTTVFYAYSLQPILVIHVSYPTCNLHTTYAFLIIIIIYFIWWWWWDSFLRTDTAGAASARLIASPTPRRCYFVANALRQMTALYKIYK